MLDQPKRCALMQSYNEKKRIIYHRLQANNLSIFVCTVLIYIQVLVGNSNAVGVFHAVSRAST